MRHRGLPAASGGEPSAFSGNTDGESRRYARPPSAQAFPALLESTGLRLPRSGVIPANPCAPHLPAGTGPLTRRAPWRALWDGEAGAARAGDGERPGVVRAAAGAAEDAV